MRRMYPFDRLRAFPGVLLRRALLKTISSESPDFVWWSGDYLPESFSALIPVRKAIQEKSVLHVSIMDPPEVFAPESSAERSKAMALYREGTALADSISCIGELMRDRLTNETGKKVFLLSDFVENGLSPAQPKASGTVRVAIAGRIYNYVELGLFLDALGSAFLSSEVLWYGAEKNEDTSTLALPANVSIFPMNSLPRARIAEALAANCSFAYLSMPSAMPEFANYSIPTKLVTYVEAGLPVAFHAPPDSEMNLMNTKWQFGVNLSGSVTPIDRLRDIVSRRDVYRRGLRDLAHARYSKVVVMATVEQILATTNACLRAG